MNQSHPALSHHLALLRHGGIIAARRGGSNNYYRLTEDGQNLAKVVKGMTDWSSDGTQSTMQRNQIR